MDQLERFIEDCKLIDNLVSVSAHEPTKLHLDQIKSKYDFDIVPTLFKFCVKDSQGTPQNFEIIVPHHIWSTSLPPRHELAQAAERCRTVPQEHTFFLLPETIDSVPLLGRELKPISSPSENLSKLLDRLKSLECVEAIDAYKIVDPDIIAQVGDTEAVLIKIDVLDITISRLNEIGDIDDDEIDMIVAKNSYDNEDNHDSLVLWATERISELTKK